VLISFEGIDGSGKTTQINLLKKRVESAGLNVFIFREPGGTELSEAIRSILLNPETDIHPITEILLFSSARSQLVAERVKPLLDGKTLVILDRYYDSTVAYQGYGRKCLSISKINQINEIASHGIAPEITFYMRVDLETAIERRSHMSKDRMEQSGETFYKDVIKGFDELAKSSERFVTIDALKSIEVIHQLIWERVTKLLPLS
jgi:dTMP kinase